MTMFGPHLGSPGIIILMSFFPFRQLKFLSINHLLKYKTTTISSIVLFVVNSTNSKILKTKKKSIKLFLDNVAYKMLRACVCVSCFVFLHETNTNQVGQLSFSSWRLAGLMSPHSSLKSFGHHQIVGRGVIFRVVQPLVSAQLPLNNPHPCSCKQL